MKKRKASLENSTLIIVSNKNHQCNLKLVSKMWWETIYLQNLKISSHNVFITNRRKNNNYTVEKPGTHHFNKIIKVSITNNNPYWCQMPPDVKKVTNQTFTLWYSSYNTLPEYSYDEKSNTKCEIFYKVIEQYSSKCPCHERWSKTTTSTDWGRLKGHNNWIPCGICN